MINLENDTLEIHFPHLHATVGIEIEFKRTLRVEENRFTHSLPPDFGNFKVSHIEDFDLGEKNYLKKRGGVLIPMSQSDALWLDFKLKYNHDKKRDIDYTCPVALKVATGKICAVSGKTWKQGLSSKPQNYLIIPDQPWLDGFNDKLASVRQFVAAPLGKGLTIEGQLTGKEEVAGIQIEAYPLKEKYYKKLITERTKEHVDDLNRYLKLMEGIKSESELRASYSSGLGIKLKKSKSYDTSPRNPNTIPEFTSPEDPLFRKGYSAREPQIKEVTVSAPIPNYLEEDVVDSDFVFKKSDEDIPDIGLAPGGNIIQEIYRDRFGSKYWDTKNSLRCFVTLANGIQWPGITGEKPPMSRISPSDYKMHNVKWHDQYGEDRKAIQGAKKLRNISPTGKKKVAHTIIRKEILNTFPNDKIQKPINRYKGYPNHDFDPYKYLEKRSINQGSW